MEPHSLSMEYRSEQLLKLYPRSPLLTSLATAWQTISLAYLRLPAFELPEYCTPFHCVTILTAPNTAERTIAGKSQTNSSQAGEIIVIPTDISASARWLGAGETIAMGLDPVLFASAIDDATANHATELVPQFPTPDPLVHQIGLALKAALEESATGNRLYAETAAAMLAVHLLRRYGNKQKLEFKTYRDGLSQFALRQVVDYIHAHLDRALGLAELAAIAHLSPHYFTRLFEQSTGLTPHQYVIRTRVERAKTLLLSGKGSIAEIARQVGFANQAHLNVHLKRWLGVTPKAILKQRKN